MNVELAELRKYLGALVLGPGVEVEARFVVSKAQFYQALQALRNEQLQKVQIEDHRFAGDIRHRRRTVAGVTTEEWMRKTRNGTPYDSSEFSFRIGVATETVVPPLPAKQKPTSVQTSTRYEQLLSTNLRLDFIAQETDFRIELELLERDLEELIEWIRVLLAILQQSRIPIGQNERRKVILAYNQLMDPTSTNGEALQRGSLPHPEDLTMFDLYNGTLLARGRNSVTRKADGETKELLLLDNGIYAVSGRNQVNLLGRLRIKELVPALFQGELLFTEEVDFLLFETLFTQGQDHRDKPLDERRKYQEALAAAFANHPTLHIRMKEFGLFSTTDDQYSAINTLLDREIDFEDDGLIFTEVDQPYRQGAVRIKKAKALQDLTIDLQIRPDGLYTVDDRQKYLPVPFVGTKHYPFRITPAQIKEVMAEQEFIGYQEIWEFRFIDPETQRFYDRPRALRPRYDKSSPNKLSTAINVWELLHRPLAEKTLRGADLELMQRYHNQEKKALYALIPDRSTILDLGSGRGGDVFKWAQKQLTVYPLEPDAENRAELLKRVREAHLEGKVKPPAGFGAEESVRVQNELLKGVQVDAVSMQFILTFFYQSSAKLDGLLDTLEQSLKPGGKVILTTADGDRILTGMRGASRLVTPQYSLDRSGRELQIHINDSIVRNQTEWLPDLVELDLRLQRRGFRLLQKHHLDKVEHLPKQQRILSQMYAALVYEKIDPNAPVKPVVTPSAPTQPSRPSKPVLPPPIQPAKPTPTPAQPSRPSKPVLPPPIQPSKPVLPAPLTPARPASSVKPAAPGPINISDVFSRL